MSVEMCFSWSRVQPRITNYISLSCLLVSFNVPDKNAFLSDQCKETEKNNRMRRLEIFQENQRYQGNISCKDGHNKGKKQYGPNRSTRC